MREFLFGIAEITLGMSLLILLMLVLLKLIGGKFTAKCRYILWTLVMIRLAVPLSFGILPALIEVPVEPESEPMQIQIPVVSYTPIPQNPVPVQIQEQLQIPSPPVETPMFTEPEPEQLTWEDLSAYIPHLYLTGAAVFLMWNLLSYTIYTGRIVRSAKPADPEALRVYETVCRKKELHRPPVLLMSPGLSSPAAFGLLRRRIVLPDIDLSENGLVGTLSHEVTHCKRGDLWIKAVCLLARSFHWFNPLVHLAAFRCEMEMELSCDESVLTGCSEETRAAYGEVMLDIIRRCRRNRGSLTTHFNPKKNAVKARFTNILYGSGKRKGLWLIAVCLVLCLIAGAVVACTTDVPEDETEPEPTETPDEPLPETNESGEYPSMEAYVNERMAKETTAQYYSIGTDGSISNQPKTANVTDTKLTVLEKKGEVIGLSPDGVLECWRYKYLLKLDVPTEEVIPVGGQEVEDDWFDLEGQNGHTVVTLRHPDGTYTILMDEMTGDSLDFTGYRNSYEEAIYDWYVTESGLDLPLYVEDWSEQITSPTGEYLGNHPVHRFDGDGWGIYIPVSAWYRSPDAMENQWIWCSSYLTGSMLTVDVFSHTLEDEYVTAKLQGYTPTDRTNRIWELHIDDIHSYYYYYENPDGGFWRVTIGWTEEAITDYPYIAIEPQVLKLMAESFVIYSNAKSAVNTITSPIYRCNDMYILENTAIHGESTITFPDGFGSFELYSCKVILCDDNCDPYSVVFRQFWGYAGGWPLEPAAEYEVSDRWKYPTRLYLCTVPEENLENMRGTPEQIEAYGNRRAYLYLMTLSENLYAYICVNPPEDINTTPAPENERELADTLVSGAQIAYTYSPVSVSEPAVLWQNFLDTVVAPYQNYIVSTEYLDLDGNGIDELIIYDLGMGVAEIFTIEAGKVRSFYTEENILTIYSDNRKALAPPAAHAVETAFYGKHTPSADTVQKTKNWFVPTKTENSTTGKPQYILYSGYGHEVTRYERYYLFQSEADGCLTVKTLYLFSREAVDSNPLYGWNCYVKGQQVSNAQYAEEIRTAWADIAELYGVQYTDENTYTGLSVIENTPDAAEPEPVVQPEPEAEDTTGLVTEEFDLFTREEWITYHLNTDFGFREPVDVSALTDAELEVYMTDAYSCAKDIFWIYDVNSDTMYGGRYWSTTMPNVILGNNYYSKMYNPVFRTMADWEGYMRGILSDELVGRLLETDRFIDYEGELWGIMGARGTDFSRKTIGYSVTSRSDTEIIYTAEVEFRMELGTEEPDSIEYYNFTYALTENGWRWTDFYLYQ